MSIKKCFDITACPLTNVLRLNRNLLPLRDKSWQQILAIFIQSVHLSRSSEERDNMRGVSGINTSIESGRSHLQCVADMCSVNHLSINGRERPLYSRATAYEVFRGGYRALNND